MSVSSSQFSIGEITRLEHQQWLELNRHWYPNFHVGPPIGWLSVPHGCCQHNGVYHVFYQHHPFSEDWGLMYWGHATSTDLVHWEHQPVALAPGDTFDKDGCFSGSAVSHNGKLYIFYTGHTWDYSVEGEDNIYQMQCLAVSEDGIHFEKRGVVIRPPPGFVHFRDPKVWRHAGRWWMVLGARDFVRDTGEALLFWTTDVENWDETQFMVLGRSDDKNVFMWECPDFFITEGIAVLLYCPQGLKPKGYNFRNRFQSGYMLGQWEPGKPFASQTKFRELDRGHDFYAPQTFQSADGRQLLFGWMGMWENPMPSKKYGWSGVLTIPREIELEENGGEKLIMKPAREMEALRGDTVLIPQQTIDQDSEVIICPECTSHEVLVTFNTDCSTAEKYGLWLGKGLEIFVDTQCNRLVVYRHYPEHMLSGYRSLFVNGGQEVFSTRVYPEGDYRLKLVAFYGQAFVVSGKVIELSRGTLSFDPVFEEHTPLSSEAEVDTYQDLLIVSLSISFFLFFSSGEHPAPFPLMPHPDTASSLSLYLYMLKILSTSNSCGEYVFIHTQRTNEQGGLEATIYLFIYYYCTVFIAFCFLFSFALSKLFITCRPIIAMKMKKRAAFGMGCAAVRPDAENWKPTKKRNEEEWRRTELGNGWIPSYFDPVKGKEPP
eukprot:gene9833-6906_t